MIKTRRVFCFEPWVWHNPNVLPTRYLTHPTLKDVEGLRKIADKSVTLSTQNPNGTEGVLEKHYGIEPGNMSFLRNTTSSYAVFYFLKKIYRIGILSIHFLN